MKKVNRTENPPAFDNSFVDKSLPTISWSTIGGLLKEPFDQIGVATKTYGRHFNNPKSEYYHMTVDQIIEKWQKKGADSLRYGRLNDDYMGIILEGDESDLEMYKLDNEPENDERLANLMAATDSFFENMPEGWEFVTREKTVYLKMDGFYVKGRFDALFYDTINKKWIIVDWKTSGSIDTTPSMWTGKLLGAAKSLDDLNWNEYTLQTYFYKTAFVESGYIPGISYDDIDIRIVNLPGTVFKDGDLFKAYGPAFEYDADFMKKIFTFAFKKNEILQKKTAQA